MPARDSARAERFAAHKRTLDAIWIRVENEVLAARPHRDRSPAEMHVLITLEVGRRLQLAEDAVLARDTDFQMNLAGL
jgi:hypothetical protein